MQNPPREKSEFKAILQRLRITEPRLPLPKGLSQRGSRISLMTLLLAVAAFAVLLAMFLPNFRSIVREAAAFPKRDWNVEISATIRATLRDRGTWEDISKLTTSPTPAEMLRMSARNSRLTKLDLVYSQVLDSDLHAFAKLRNIREVSLDGTAITDAGLRPLSSLPRLRFLSLNGCGITDHGLDCFSDSTSLEELDLRNTLVTNAGMKHLATIKRLRKVRIECVGVTTEGIDLLLQNQSIRLLIWNGQGYDGSALRDLRQEIRNLSLCKE